MSVNRFVILGFAVILMQGCGTYSSSSFTEAPGLGSFHSTHHREPSQVFLTQGDIINRRYVVLGDISVSVSKYSLFDKDPTQASVNDALKEKAADLGADAVIFARYGNVGISFSSWGTLDGNGRAVMFQ